MYKDKMEGNAKRILTKRQIISKWYRGRIKTFLLIIKILPWLIFLCSAGALAIFLVSANQAYHISSNFDALPHAYDPDTGTSSIKWQGAEVTIKDGFVKGYLEGEDGRRLVLRALSPFPSLSVKSDKDVRIEIRLENVDPDRFTSAVNRSDIAFTLVEPSVLEFSIKALSKTKENLVPHVDPASLPSTIGVLGDSRDGYDTFTDMVDRVNAAPVLFSIDNGDLVFNGKPNQYRLFDRILSRSNKTVCLVPGNHDIRMHGRATYELLYGPEYYSFDVGSNHFAFLDSSTGWATKTAIPETQYQWLERDLAKAAGKRLFVITHIPPTDPRANLTRRESANYFDGMDQDDNLLEKKIEAINDAKKLAHGFPTRTEADRFEKIMEKYGVTAVFLSHIHSFFDFTKNGVRYLITGGAGAELLTKDSYYHFLIYDTAPNGDLTMVERPTPPNLYLQRYASTIVLFATALYRENKLVVDLFLIGLILTVLLILVNILIAKRESLGRLWDWAKDVGRYIHRSFGVMVLRRADTDSTQPPVQSGSPGPGKQKHPEDKGR